MAYAALNSSLGLRVDNAAKAQRARPIFAGGHQQKLSVLIVAVGLREVPNGPLWLVIAPAAQNRRAGVLIRIFVGPLPNVANHVHDTEETRSHWMRGAIIWTS